MEEALGINGLQYYELDWPPCVYFLMQGEEVVYVGQTNCLPDRIIWHRRDKKVFDGVWFLPVDAGDLVLLEGRYIDRFRPRYNKTGKG